MPRPSVLTLYVTTPSSPLARVIPSGSAIIGSPYGHAIRIDYEGDEHHTPNPRRYIDRVRAAAERHLLHYPTVARAWVEPKMLIAIGAWNPQTQALTLDHPAALAWWLGLPAVPPEELGVPAPEAAEAPTS